MHAVLLYSFNAVIKRVNDRAPCTSLVEVFFCLETYLRTTECPRPRSSSPVSIRNLCLFLSTSFWAGRASGSNLLAPHRRRFGIQTIQPLIARPRPQVSGRQRGL